MRKRFIAVMAMFCIAMALLAAGCVQTSPTGNQTATPNKTQSSSQVLVMYAGAGQMPVLLSTDQIDGYIIWQPFVAVATESGIGKVVVYSQDLPPDGVWEDHTCDGLDVNQNLLDSNPALVDTISALTIAATDYVREHPDSAAEISAGWLFGSGNMTFGNVTVSSVEVEKVSIPTIKFTNDPSQAWLSSNDLFIESLKQLGLVTGKLNNVTAYESLAILFDFSSYDRAKAMVANKSIKGPSAPVKNFAIGYLPSDHDAALFVAVKEWKYFQDTYGAALKPRDVNAAKADVVDLVVNGTKIAEVRLVKGEGGPQLMTLMAQDSVQFSIAGTPPTISAVDKGTPIKILFPVHTEGSGLVVAADAPVSDWGSFVTWAKQRADAGKPLVIAAPLKGSIQDVMFRYALENSGVVVKQA